MQQQNSPIKVRGWILLMLCATGALCATGVLRALSDHYHLHVRAKVHTELLKSLDAKQHQQLAGPSQPRPKQISLAQNATPPENGGGGTAGGTLVSLRMETTAATPVPQRTEMPIAGRGGADTSQTASKPNGTAAKSGVGGGQQGRGLSTEWVGRPSPLWKGPNEVLVQAWRKVQEQGTREGRIAKYRGAGGLANTWNGLLSGALHALLTGRRFAFESVYNSIFRSREQQWDFGSVDMNKLPSLRSAKKTSHIDWCFSGESEQGKILSTLSNGVDLPYSTGPSVFYETNCPFYKHWANNPHMAPKLHELGLVTKDSALPYKFQVAHQLTRLLAQPQDDLAKLVRETFEGNATNGAALVGVQVG